MSLWQNKKIKTKTALKPFCLVEQIVLIVFAIVSSWRSHCVYYCDAIQNAFAVVVVVSAIFYVAVNALIFFHTKSPPAIYCWQMAK